MHARGLVVAAAVAAIAALAYGDAPISLTDGVPVTGLSGAAGSTVFYEFVVPPGQGELEIEISGGTGDCDLYVKRGDLPGFHDYDYRPYQFGNNETVTVTNPAADTWYIMLRARSDYSGLTLVARCEPAVPIELQNGVPDTGISGDEDTETLYYIDVPAGQDALEINTWDGDGDVDLYVKRGSPPSSSDYDEGSFGSDNEESLFIGGPAAGRWYIVLEGADDYSGVTLRATYGSGSVTTLDDETPVTGLSGAAGSEACFVIDVPDGYDRIAFKLSGGTGDCDMYIKQGVKPTTSDYDYQPGDSGNNESMLIGIHEGGSWYVLLVGDEAYNGVTLAADYYRSEDPAEEDALPLTSGVPVTDIAGRGGEELFFKIDVPSGVKKLEVKMSGGIGDADLYVRRGARPTTSEYDYRPYQSGNDESVTISSPAAGTWYIMIRGYKSYAGITLVATFDGGSADGIFVLSNGVAVTGLAGLPGSEKFFKIEVPADQTKLEIAMSGGPGDADLFVRIGAKPSTHQWDYRPYLFGSKETVTIHEPKAGTYYLMIRGYLGYAGVTLKATYTPQAKPDDAKALEDGVSLAGLAGAEDSEAFYRIDVPDGQKLLTIEISGDTGDADLYVKKGEKPTMKSWDYRPYLHGSNEIVEVPDPAAGTWYIMIRGYEAYENLTLHACLKMDKKEDCKDCVVVFP
jgi:hypothetical protein